MRTRCARATDMPALTLSSSVHARGMIDRDDRVRLPGDERPQQCLVREASAGLHHVREEEVVGVLDACSALELRAGQCEPSSAHCGAASQPIAFLHEGDTPSVCRETLRRR